MYEESPKDNDSEMSKTSDNNELLSEDGFIDLSSSMLKVSTRNILLFTSDSDAFEISPEVFNYLILNRALNKSKIKVPKWLEQELKENVPQPPSDPEPPREISIKTSNLAMNATIYFEKKITEYVEGEIKEFVSKISATIRQLFTKKD